ncbi:NAD(P)/FAD-dependent oxidoreductase [Nonomuraea typhae]|uniref:NAD(P)/FAD-dependent oxidoreductase n=1 Tax=Nonomuraea typhae TaxID=2603600 RepID=UPI0012FC3536|nr:FAD-dependent oxidoreductase [Nonomuraea typhae]
MKVSVVGGGVIGLACAWSLTRRGFEVTVLDAGRVGDGASAANGGWITPSLSVPLSAPGVLRTGLRHALRPDGALVIKARLDASWLRWLWRFRSASSPAVFDRGVRALLDLNQNTLDLFDAYRTDGVSFEMHGAGLLALARDRDGLSDFQESIQALQRRGYQGEVEFLGPAEAREREPAISGTVGAALRMSIDRHVDPLSLTAGLAERLRGLGGAILDHTPVTAMSRDGDGWRLDTPAGPVRADIAVVALGAASNSVLAPLGVRLPVVPAKGYAIDLLGEGHRPRHALYAAEDKIGITPLARWLRIAGVLELGGSRTASADPRRIRQIVEGARSYLADWRPAEENYGRAGRAGLRPATPDSLPFLGPVPELPGMYLATGHGMLGVTLAPATGEAIADMIENRTVPERLLPFQLAGRL